MTSGGVVAKRSFVLFLLFLIYVCNNMDRFILAILAEPIRLDLGLSDIELGMLTGLVFALFYTLFGVPVGWIADRLGRIRVIVVACAIWSFCSALGGFAGNFAQLALARIGVGVGEAGGAAPSYSLISAFYGPHERGNALGLYNLGAPVAFLVGTFACAWIAAHFGWRAAVVAVSLPGIVFALILYLSVREPAHEPDEAARPALALPRAIRSFFSTRILWLAALTAGLSSFTTYAMAAWLPAYLMRTKGMTLEELGIWYAIANALFFGFGLWFGGFLADRLVRHDVRAYALVPCCGLLLAAPFVVLAVLAPDWPLSLALWMVPVAAVATFLAPGVTVVQNVTPPAQRAVFGALFLFVNNLIGAGAGPLYVGAISDALHPAYGEQALSFGLAACVPVLLIAAGAHYLVSRHLAARTTPMTAAAVL